MTGGPDDETRRTQVYIWTALFNLFLALAGIGLMLWIFIADRGVREDIARRRAEQTACARRVITAPQPMLVDPTEAAPPQDRPREGYFGKQGTEIRAALRLSFEALRGKSSVPVLEKLRLGSPEVLPEKTIHVVNLWATWCEPCRDEMPDFKAMFARRAADWGAQVRFLPIQVKDESEPGKAYSDIERIMPAAPVKLADRALGNPLTTLLESDTDRTLFKGGLPVTLLLDCNRRVRWGAFKQLNSGSLVDLERVVDQLRAELEDTSPGSWCTQSWPGNGRCEDGENTPAGHVLEDCGELKRRPQDPAVAPVAEVVPVECPEGSEATPDGRCKRKLRGNLGAATGTPPAQSATCGNGACDGGETRETCCDDCPCDALLVCKAAGDGHKRCMVKGLRGG